MRITHILFSWTISIVLPNHTQFIVVNCMPYIAHTLIWLPISVALNHHKQFFWINCLPLITQATLIWTVFDVAAIANVLHLFWRFYYIIVSDWFIANSFVEGSLIRLSRLDHPAVVMVQTRHYDQRPFDETVCDAIITNSGVKTRQKRCKTFAMTDASNTVQIFVACAI